jgi:hypothetical protein
MKTMTLRILFTAAILAGLAAAPGAQTPGPQRGSRAGVAFRWEPNRGRDTIGERVDRALDQAERSIERRWQTFERQWEMRSRAAERAAAQAQRNAERRAATIERQVRARVQRQAGAPTTRTLRRGVEINNEIRAYRNYSDRLALGAGRAERYADMQVGTDADACRNYNDRDDDYYQHCEVRDSNLPAGPLNVDAGQNGGVSVEAWDRNEIRVRAIVRGSARSDSRAREIANQVQVQAGGGRVSATGPDLERREWWSVSYRINVPRKNDLDLSATNGGITIVGVTGNLRFDTTNGGVKLQDVGGRVNGDTRNGGLNVVLGGSQWDGEGLDVETSNGGVTLAIPDGYNAELETRTVNGGLRIDFPITVQGELSSRRGISTTLGSGGPMVRVRTTNGGVKINRR